jgi:hypothetical protein
LVNTWNKIKLLPDGVALSSHSIKSKSIQSGDGYVSKRKKRESKREADERAREKRTRELVSTLFPLYFLFISSLFPLYFIFILALFSLYFLFIFLYFLFIFSLFFFIFLYFLFIFLFLYLLFTVIFLYLLLIYLSFSARIGVMENGYFLICNMEAELEIQMEVLVPYTSVRKSGMVIWVPKYVLSLPPSPSSLFLNASAPPLTLTNPFSS